MDRSEVYRHAGLGGRAGFGQRPAIVVIDFQNAFTSEQSASGADMSDACKATRQLTDVAREKNIQIIYTRVGYKLNGVDLGIWGEKCPSLKEIQPGSWHYEWDSHLDVRPEDVEIEKHGPSAFFGTHLAPMLNAMHIDTVILCGCTVGGCVYATSLDSCSYGFRTIVPQECVADRSQEVYDLFLWNMNQKYADIMPLDDVLAAIEQLNPLEYAFRT
ncbi:isochorismatase family protein [Paenibacillus xylaniclasticus]|uniref:isochorismatase family protein n=1 Tax=Paenibacillus xylaniclasticus TaxID=588083 RepID=UPI0013DFC9DD|nr:MULTISPECIES: isochorismatase family protein [Paenibacillus]GFN33153.1 N-carbamoylsarcosine amidase [Paenibacillus curdlanolyticus]